MKRHQDDVPLRQGISDLLAEEKLDQGQLDALHALQRPARPDRRYWLSAAAAVVVSATTGYLGARHLGGGSVDHLQEMADEIAYNHLGDQPLDIVAHTLDDLRPEFAAMGFRLSDHPELRSVPGTLSGGRHCSVSSVPAALLRFEDQASNSHATVYQARHDPSKHADVPDTGAGEPPAEMRARGVFVRLWREDGVLYAIARNAD